MDTVVLRIEKATGGGYALRLFVDDGKKADWEAHPLAETKLTDAEFAEQKDLPRLDDDIVHPDLYKDAGIALFGLLNRGQVGVELTKLLEQDPFQPAPPRLVVLDLRADELEALPWELLHWDHRFLFRDEASPWIRGSIRFSYQEEPHPWPLKVLICIGAADPSKLPGNEIAWEEERDAVVTALRAMRHMADYEVVIQPSKAKLLARYEEMRPHVFHFIGHGGDDLLCYDDANRAMWAWDAENIAQDLRRKAPCIAFLNACRSAASRGNGWSIREALLKIGTRAVVGMQGDVPGKAAARFAKSFYESLFQHKGAELDLPTLVARARAELAKETQRVEWALPSLSLVVRPRMVLPISFEVSEKYPPTEVPEFGKLERFVDRIDERRSLTQCLDREEHPGSGDQMNHGVEHPQLLMIRGEGRVGKTSVAYWCLEHAARRGHETAYIDLREARSRDFLGLLRLIRDGSTSSENNSILRRAFRDKKNEFSRWNRDLNFILRGKAAPDEDPPQFVEDENLPFRPDGTYAENAIEQICASFLVALERAVAEDTVILALDNFHAIKDDGTSRLLQTQLFEPIARGRLERLRLLLVVHPDEVSALGLDAIHPPPGSLDLPRFPKRFFAALASEYCRFAPDSTKQKGLLEYAKLWSKDFLPEELEKIFPVFAMLP